jgi:hypothetical protein
MSKYTTANGIEIEVLAVSPWLMDGVTSTVQMPDPPTYEVSVLGEKSQIPHDETTLTTDEDKIAWAKYIIELEKATKERRERRTRAMLLFGVKVDLPKDGKWKKKQEKLHIEIPEDEDELHIHYLQTVVITSHTELVAIVDEINRLSSYDEGLVEKARKFFRGEVAQHPSERTEGAG